MRDEVIVRSGVDGRGAHRLGICMKPASGDPHQARNLIADEACLLELVYLTQVPVFGMYFSSVYATL